MSKKIIFMGTPIFAVPILKSLHFNGYPITVVYTQPPKKSYRGQKINKSPIQDISENLNIKFRCPQKLKDNLQEYEFLKKIDADLSIVVADKQREDSEKKLKEFEEIILKNKLEAKNIFKLSREKALKDINSKREILEKQIDDELKKAEQEINELKKTAPEKINKIAIETSSEILKNLIGAEVNSSSISAIVEDLYKKHGTKYYGN